MADDLRFLAKIEQALRAEEPGAALAQALGESRGDPQFERFIAEVAEARRRKSYRLFAETPQELQRGESVGLILEKEGEALDTTLLVPPMVWAVRGIVPGAYRLKLTTGWVLWERSLRGEDVLWKKAHPGKPLQAAADTDTFRPRPTIHETLLSSSFVLRVVPGLESGTIEVELAEGGDSP